MNGFGDWPGRRAAVAPATFEPDAILATLVRHRVRFVLIGGFACQFHGVGNVTLDLDVVIEASQANAEVLVAALVSMGAMHARPPGSHQVIRPSVDRVMSLRGFHHYDTHFGRLDVSKTAGGHDYDQAAALHFAPLLRAEVLLAPVQGDTELRGLPRRRSRAASRA